MQMNVLIIVGARVDQVAVVRSIRGGRVLVLVRMVRSNVDIVICIAFSVIGH